MKVLAINGSLRRKSSNLGLLKYAVAHAPAGVQITIADISAVPFFNEDIAEAPEPVKQLWAQAAQSDALIFACPEYNYSIAPALKNAIDWLSRSPNKSLVGKPVAIMGAGGGMGTSRAQYHLRQVCQECEMHALNKPEVFCNAFAGTFDEAGNLTDSKVQGDIRKQLAALQAWKTKLSG